MNDESKTNPVKEEIYIPIFEKEGMEITLSQGKGSIFFDTQSQTEEFLRDTIQKDPNGHLKECQPKILTYTRTNVSVV